MDPSASASEVPPSLPGEATIDGVGLVGLDRDRFGTEAVGIVWDSFAPDRVAAHLDVGDRHLQPDGIVHGGVWCAMVEALGSVAAAVRLLGTDQRPVGVHNATDFLRPHRSGRIDAVATPIHVGRTQQLWQVVLTRHEDGKEVARGQLRVAHVPRDAGGPA